MYRALTVARECESGGDRLAALLSKRRDRKLLDCSSIGEMAPLAREYSRRRSLYIPRNPAVEADRVRCVQMNLGPEWRTPPFSDLTTVSKLGEVLAVSTIPAGMGNPV